MMRERRVGNKRNRSHTQTHNKNNTTHDTTRTIPQTTTRRTTPPHLTIEGGEPLPGYSPPGQIPEESSRPVEKIPEGSSRPVEKILEGSSRPFEWIPEGCSRPVEWWSARLRGFVLYPGVARCGRSAGCVLWALWAVSAAVCVGGGIPYVCVGGVPYGGKHIILSGQDTHPNRSRAPTSRLRTSRLWYSHRLKRSQLCRNVRRSSRHFSYSRLLRRSGRRRRRRHTGRYPLRSELSIPGGGSVSGRGKAQYRWGGKAAGGGGAAACEAY